MMERIYNFLDREILPWPVRYLSHRFVILMTIALLVPLVIYANNQVLVLMVNSYLNTMGVAVSSIVLLYATLSEIRQKQIAEMQEKRAQEDHTHVVEMHSLLQQSLANQQEQIEDLRKMVASLHGKEYTPRAATAPVDLRALHPRGEKRFKAQDNAQRLDEHIHKHAMTDQVGKTV